MSDRSWISLAGVLLLLGGDLLSESIGAGGAESLRLRELGKLAEFELQERHGGLPLRFALSETILV